MPFKFAAAVRYGRGVSIYRLYEKQRHSISNSYAVGSTFPARVAGSLLTARSLEALAAGHEQEDPGRHPGKTNNNERPR
jgi:hypothetical protein